MATSISKGYEQARYQGFKLLDEVRDFLEYACADCLNKKKCNYAAILAVGTDYAVSV